MSYLNSALTAAFQDSLLVALKDAAAMHIRTEVVGVITTSDAHVGAVLQAVQVLVSTTDATNKLFANVFYGPRQIVEEHLRDHPG